MFCLLEECWVEVSCIINFKLPKVGSCHTNCLGDVVYRRILSSGCGCINSRKGTSEGS